MKVAVVGSTGMVGQVMLKVLEERNFPVTELIPVASERSVGKKVKYKQEEFTIVSMKDAIAAKPDIAIFLPEEILLLNLPLFLQKPAPQ